MENAIKTDENAIKGELLLRYQGIYLSGGWEKVSFEIFRELEKERQKNKELQTTVDMQRKLIEDLGKELDEAIELNRKYADQHFAVTDIDQEFEAEQSGDRIMLRTKKRIKSIQMCFWEDNEK